MKNLRDKLEISLVKSKILIGCRSKNKEINEKVAKEIEIVVWWVLSDLDENLNSYKPF